MPIYEYNCPVCGVIEVFQKINDAELEKCPYCSNRGVSSDVKRQVSLSSFRLKGSGWYQTDYNGKNSCNTCEHGTAQESNTASSPKATTEKTATKCSETKTAACAVA